MSQETIEHPWINKEFLEDLLRKNENADNIVVDSFSVCLAVAKGDNYSSQMHRVNVVYKRGGVQHKCALVVKSLPESQNMQLFLIGSGIFEKETLLYQEILPALVALTEKTKCQTTLSPRAYLTSRPHTIIMADLKEQGFKMADRRRGLDLPHAILAIKALARLHALSLVFFKREPKWMDQLQETLYVEANREKMKPMVDVTSVALPKEVEKWPNFERFGEKIRSALSVDALIKQFQVKPGGLLVLNHGDFWLNNMLFRYSNSGDVAEVRMVDFQLSRLATPALDIQYFIHSSLSMVVREMFVKKLLEEYHREFCDTLAKMGCDPTVMSLRQLEDEMEEKLYYGLFTACTVLPIVLAHSKFAVDVEKLMETPNTGVLDEGQQKQKAQDVGDAAGMGNTYSGVQFQKMFQKILLQVEKKGLFNAKK